MSVPAERARVALGAEPHTNAANIWLVRHPRVSGNCARFSTLAHEHMKTDHSVCDGSFRTVPCRVERL